MSKTLKIINKYLYSEDVEMDGMEGIDATDTAEQPPATPDPLTVESEKVYADLIIKAFLAEPSDSDAIIARDLQPDVETDPKAVVAKLMGLMHMSEGDMKDTLSQS
jgi:hypothetical protein